MNLHQANEQKKTNILSTSVFGSTVFILLLYGVGLSRSLAISGKSLHSSLFLFSYCDKSEKMSQFFCFWLGSELFLF